MFNKIEDKNEYLAMLTQHVSDAIVSTDMNFNIISWNNAAENIYGWKPEEVIGKSTKDILNTVYQTGQREDFTIQLMENGFWQGEVIQHNRDSAVLHIHSSVSMLKDNSGATIGAVAINRDITSRKLIDEFQRFLAQYDYINAGESFYESLARFIAEKLKMDYVCIDRLIQNNLAARTLAIYFDGHFEDNVEYTLMDTPCGAVVNKAVCTFAQGVRHLFPNDVVLQEMCAESYVGTTLWSSTGEAIGLIALIARTPLLNVKSVETIIQLVATRVASELERKQSEEKLLESKLRYERIVKNVPGVLFDLIKYNEGNYKLLYISPRSEELFEIVPEQFLHDSTIFWNLVHPDDIDALRAEEFMLQHDKIDISNIEFRITTPSGTVKWVSCMASLSNKDATDNSIWCGVMLDVTARKIAELELQNSHQQLAELNATKDKFFSLIAHDLKNPFSSLIGLSGIIADNVSNFESVKIEKFARVINETAKRSYELLENLLTWARTQTGAITASPSQINLRVLINDTVVQHSQQAMKKEISLTHSVTLENLAYADENMLRTILRNLTTNAIKFTNKGGSVSLTAREDCNYIELAVADTGIGIKPETIERLFRIDTAISSPGTANEKGTGLGLILCKDFVERNNGTITVNSQVGKGTEFVVKIPKLSNN